MAKSSPYASLNLAVPARFVVDFGCTQFKADFEFGFPLYKLKMKMY